MKKVLVILIAEFAFTLVTSAQTPIELVPATKWTEVTNHIPVSRVLTNKDGKNLNVIITDKSETTVTILMTDNLKEFTINLETLTTEDQEFIKHVVAKEPIRVGVHPARKTVLFLIENIFQPYKTEEIYRIDQNKFDITIGIFSNHKVHSLEHLKDLAMKVKFIDDLEVAKFFDLVWTEDSFSRSKNLKDLFRIVEKNGLTVVVECSPLYANKQTFESKEAYNAFKTSKSTYAKELLTFAKRKENWVFFSEKIDLPTIERLNNLIYGPAN